MIPTKCDQAQVDGTLRSGVRVKNEGKFELFAVTRTLKFSTLPSSLIISHTNRDECFHVVYHLCDGIEDNNQSTQNSSYPYILSNSHIEIKLNSEYPISLQVKFRTLLTKRGQHESNFVCFQRYFLQRFGFYPHKSH